MGLIRLVMKSGMIALVGLGGYYLGMVKSGQQGVAVYNSALETALSQNDGKLEGKCIADASQPGKYIITMDYSGFSNASSAKK